MSAFQLYRTSSFSQNLSRRALNVFKVGDETMLSGKLFHNGIILLEKLNLRISYVTAAMQIYDFLCHTVFLYNYPLSIQLSHCHIYPQRFYTAQSYLLLSSGILK